MRVEIGPSKYANKEGVTVSIERKMPPSYMAFTPVGSQYKPMTDYWFPDMIEAMAHVRKAWDEWNKPEPSFVEIKEEKTGFFGKKKGK